MTAEIFNHLWQSTAFAAACALITLAFRKNRAQVRYTLWIAASLKFLIPFASLVAVGRAAGRWLLPPATGHRFSVVLEQVTLPIGRAAIPPATRLPGLIERAGSTMETVIPVVLLAVWAVGSFVLLARWLAEWRRVAAVVARSIAVTEGREIAILRRLENARRARRRVTVLASDSSMEPGVLGWYRPRLLWPRGISAHLDDSQVEAILAHELSHVGRYDNLIATIQMAVQAAFWFHPLVWWIGARLVDERERACDEDVLRSGSEPEVYAESILRTCRFSIESPLACVAGVTGADLKRRIEGIMSHRKADALSMSKRIALSFVALVAGAGPVGIGVMSAPRVWAQTSDSFAGNPRFEVASVKPNDGKEVKRVALMMQPGGRVQAVNVPLSLLV